MARGKNGKNSMNQNFESLINQLKQLINLSRNFVYHQVNTMAVLTNFEIGRMIVEYEQEGKDKAEYGAGTLKKLSTVLTNELGRGYSVDNLERMRKFYIVYKDRISAAVLRKLISGEKSATVSRISNSDGSTQSLLQRDKIKFFQENINYTCQKRRSYANNLIWLFIEHIKTAERQACCPLCGHPLTGLSAGHPVIY